MATGRFCCRDGRGCFQGKGPLLPSACVLIRKMPGGPSKPVKILIPFVSQNRHRRIEEFLSLRRLRADPPQPRVVFLRKIGGAREDEDLAKSRSLRGPNSHHPATPPTSPQVRPHPGFQQSKSGEAREHGSLPEAWKEKSRVRSRYFSHIGKKCAYTKGPLD